MAATSANLSEAELALLTAQAIKSNDKCNALEAQNAVLAARVAELSPGPLGNVGVFLLGQGAALANGFVAGALEAKFPGLPGSVAGLAAGAGTLALAKLTTGDTRRGLVATSSALFGSAAYDMGRAAGKSFASRADEARKKVSPSPASASGSTPGAPSPSPIRPGAA